MVRDTGHCVIHGERERETAPVQTPVSAPVYNLKNKIFYTFTFIKKAVKRSLERYRVRQVNLVRLTVSTGSPGPKNKSCTNKTYISYLRKAARGPSD